MAAPLPTARHQRLLTGAALAVVAVVALVLPLYLSVFWLQLAASVCALAVGCVGLTMLTGAGQLSLAHPFFMAIGALTYVALGATPDASGELVGLGLPPVLAAVAGVLAAGVVGLAFAPIASRLQGIYLGMASLGLVLLGTHVFNNVTALSGGFNGRRAPDFELFGVVFGRSPDPVVVLGVPFGRLEWLWYLGILCLAAVAVFSRNVLRSRPGRALGLIATGELPAAVAGVNVKAYKARIFFLSSLYAGLSGVLYALAIGSIAPTTFGFDLSLQLLAMVVIGGVGSVGGAIAGSTFVVCLPVLVQLALAGSSLTSGALTASYLSRYVYGAAIIAVLVFRPTGLAGVWHSTASALRRRTKRIHTTGRE
ncbi:branched-chain amino acid ABC transporter permease [Blastococcus sp. SYSU D00820]